MTKEGSHSPDRTSSPLETSSIAKQITEVRSKLHHDPTERLLDTDQNNSSIQSFWFRSHFNRGLLWGAIFSLTAVSSGMFGMALTRIDGVNLAIAQRLNPRLINTPEKPATLNLKSSILLVEVKSNADEIVEFYADSQGKLHNVLLLHLNPKLELAKAINIPLDSQVKLPGDKPGTINDAYRIGGMELLTKAIGQISHDYKVDRFVRATPEIFQQLTSSGKIIWKKCDPRISNCQDKSEQIARQQTAFETIRQRLNIPSYWSSFESAIARIEPSLDTNISVPEIIALANFVKELDSNSITVNLLAEYTPGRSQPNRVVKSPKDRGDRFSSEQNLPLGSDRYKYRAIAIQNTTDNPELGRQVVAYLRHRNFQDVYLVRHLPLKLEQTKIVVAEDELETARYLQSVLGFGKLKQELIPLGDLTIQLGEDALYLPTNYRSYN